MQIWRCWIYENVMKVYWAIFDFYRSVQGLKFILSVYLFILQRLLFNLMCVADDCVVSFENLHFLTLPALFASENDYVKQGE